MSVRTCSCVALLCVSLAALAMLVFLAVGIRKGQSEFIDPCCKVFQLAGYPSSSSSSTAPTPVLLPLGNYTKLTGQLVRVGGRRHPLFRQVSGVPGVGWNDTGSDGSLLYFEEGGGADRRWCERGCWRFGDPESDDFAASTQEDLAKICPGNFVGAGGFGGGADSNASSRLLLLCLE